jgi:hypothetical protein
VGGLDMRRGNVTKALVSIFLAAEVAVAATAVQAGSTANGAAGGGFPQYRYEADAKKNCRNDKVVWGSSAHRGIFYAEGTGPQRIGGFYACMADAKKAHMQIQPAS